MRAVDLSLVGCTLTLSVLSKEIENLTDTHGDSTTKMKKGKKLKYLWNEESMNELLQQLRGQSLALNLLLKALDSSSIEQILNIVQEAQPTLRQVRDGADSVRRCHPDELYAESITDMNFDDTQTIYSIELPRSIAHREPKLSSEVEVDPAIHDTRSNQAVSLSVNVHPHHTTAGVDAAPWKIDTSAKYQAALHDLLRRGSIPALAVDIVSNSSASEIHVIGNRRNGYSTPVARPDRFLIANSDVFTTTVLAVLVQRGIFRWEEKIVDLFPSLSSRIHPFHHQTTLATLGAHYSGMTSEIQSVEDGDLLRYLHGVDAKKGRSAVALSYLGRPPDADPGSAYSWNWANPIIVAHAIEERTSTSLEVLMKDLVFDPLEMYSAGFKVLEVGKESSTTTTATQPWGHRGGSKSPLNPSEQGSAQPPALSASTGIRCSAIDYAAFVKMHLSVARGLPTQVLQPQPEDPLYTRLFGTDRTSGGWSIASREWAAGEALTSSGRCDGFSISTWVAPLKGKAFFAIANVDGVVGMKATDDAVYMAIKHAMTW